jgi:hypothetical protein
VVVKMPTLAPFAYAPNGESIVCADGDELLVYDGESEAPRWRKPLGAPLVGVLAVPPYVAALDESGTFRWFLAEDGSPVLDPDASKLVSERSVGAPARSIANAQWTNLAVVLVEEGVVLLPWAGEPRPLELEGRPTCVAMDVTGSNVAVGGSDGRLTVFDSELAVATWSSELGSAVQSVAWCSRGHWVAAAGSTIFSVQELGNRAERWISVGGEPETLACSTDGQLLAWRAGAHAVQVLHCSSRKVVARVTYEKEVVGQISFGPDRWLGIGLAGGEANKINLVTQSVRRTETHPGRRQRSWVPGLLASAIPTATAELDLTELPRPSPAAKTKTTKPVEKQSPSRRRMTMLVLIGFLLLLSLLAWGYVALKLGSSQ